MMVFSLKKAWVKVVYSWTVEVAYSWLHGPPLERGCRLTPLIETVGCCLVMTTCCHGEMTEDSQRLLTMCKLQTADWLGVQTSSTHFLHGGQPRRKMWGTQLNVPHSLCVNIPTSLGRFLGLCCPHSGQGKILVQRLLQGGAELPPFAEPHTGRTGDGRRKPGGAGKCYWCLTPLGAFSQTKARPNPPRGGWHSTQWPLRWDLMG